MRSRFRGPHRRGPGLCGGADTGWRRVISTVADMGSPQLPCACLSASAGFALSVSAVWMALKILVAWAGQASPSCPVRARAVFTKSVKVASFGFSEANFAASEVLEGMVLRDLAMASWFSSLFMQATISAALACLALLPVCG